MARFIFGSFFSDTIIGSNGRDFVFGNGGNDYIETRGGNDIVFAGSGNDIVIAGSGNDLVFGGSGNDWIEGGSGNDYLSGSSGSDTLFAGSGNDRLYGGSGNDILVSGDGYDYLSGGSGSDILIFGGSDVTGYRNDYFNGGRGTDTLLLDLSAAQFESQDVADDFARFQSYIDAGSNGTFTFTAFDLTIRSIEGLRVFVDGVEVDPADAGPDVGGGLDPVAVDDAFDVTEDDAVTGNVLANDQNVAGETVTLIADVDSGALTLNPDGSFTFDAGTDFDSLAAGETQTVTFTYEVSGNGTTRQATATITITGTNDAPTISGAVSAAADEDAAAFTVDLLEGADDVDNGAELSIAGLTGLVAGVTLDGSTVSVDPSDAAFQALAVGESQVIIINYNIVDGEGGSVAQSATITITGTNDAPTVEADLTAAADEDAAAFTVDLLEGSRRRRQWCGTIYRSPHRSCRGCDSRWLDCLCRSI
ncbi:VCBS domain-containing protein [Litorimonas sp. RW-G-Af-16]|uniref:Ig-like domain-containing protein n=1 Tax=Litorimonas sp. RW-G-Af-16 TaxID=3241168 RepID=UPI003AAAEA4E